MNIENGRAKVNQAQKMAACEGNIRRPGTSRERAVCDIRVLVPLDRGLSESGSSSQPAIFKRSVSCEL